jgi:ABC-type polysaccharide/polyol phosphate transport system ATPase subunit
LIRQDAVTSVSRDEATGPVSVRARGVTKSFRVLSNRTETLKEHLLNPGHLLGRDERRLVALNGVDFEIKSGEFFGIVGRNGSGKSTLLKLMASIYRLDSGEIEVAGQIAPFIELGVGFNPELTARENVALNGVMMGLSITEAQERYDEVIEFAELESYTDLPLKNYSSGMHVRLAFSLMLQARADVLLIDEVLAVGDASFQRKCTDALEFLRSEGKTIVLVTHDMAAVQRHCDRAMLIEGGVVDTIGEPTDVADRYVEISYEKTAEATASGEKELKAQVSQIELRDTDDQPVRAVHTGQNLQVVAEIEGREPVQKMLLYVEIATASVIRVAAMAYAGEEIHGLERGEKAEVRFEFECPLGVGEYMLRYYLGSEGEIIQPTTQAFPFSVVQGASVGTLVTIPYERKSRRLGDDE